MSQSDQNPAAGSSRANFPKLTIRNKPGAEGKITSGANVEIRLDGQKLPMVSFLKLELKPSKIAKVTLEMYVEVDAEINPGDFHTVEEKDTGMIMKTKPVAIRTLSNLEPSGIAFKKMK